MNGTGWDWQKSVDSLRRAIAGLHIVADHANGKHEIGGLEAVFDAAKVLAAAVDEAVKERDGLRKIVDQGAGPSGTKAADLVGLTRDELRELEAEREKREAAESRIANESTAARTGGR